MNKMDKLFRDKLENFHASVPEGMWENIDQRLSDKTVVRHRDRWMIMSSFAIIFLMSVLYITIDPTERTMLNNENTTNGKLIIAENNLPHCLNEKTAFNLPDSEQTPSRSTGKVGVEKNTYVYDKDIQKFKGYKEVEGHVFERQSVAQNENELLTQEEKISPAASDHNLKDEHEVSGLNSISELIVESSLLSSQSGDPKDAVAIDEKKQDNFSEKPAEIKDPQAKSCPFGESSRNVHIDAYISHDYAMRNLSDPTFLHRDYLDMRNETERSVYSFSAGMRLGYNVGYRWNLYTGFNYSQINERFEYTDPESQVTKVIITKDYVYQQGKIIDSIITEEVVTIPGTTKIKVFNRYRTFDVPVLGRYTLYADRNISLSAMAGVFVNIAFRQKGMIIGTDVETPVDIKSGPDEQKNIFKSQLGVTGYGSLSLAWHITPVLDILIEPHFRMHTTSLTHEKYPLQQRYNTVGLTTGARYRF